MLLPGSVWGVPADGIPKGGWFCSGPGLAGVGEEPIASGPSKAGSLCGQAAATLMLLKQEGQKLKQLSVRKTKTLGSELIR